MAKHTIREEKNCLNCGAEVLHKFCPACGQQNIEPKISIKDLLNDLLHDLTHFDGKFFSTVKLLIQKPGFLTTAFIAGKRSSYLHPVRMYVFTSALFFFLFYSFFVTVPEKKSDIIEAMSKEDLFSKLNQGTANAGKLKFANGFVIAKKSDTLYNLNDINQLNHLRDSITSSEYNKGVDIYLSDSDSLHAEHSFKSIEEYEKQQASLPKSKQDDIVKSFIAKRTIRINAYFRKDAAAASLEQQSIFFHSFPTLLFISLPLLALILQLFFIRRKNLGYAVHGIFLLHLYVFSFVALLFYFTVVELFSLIHIDLPGIFGALIFMGVILYGYKALKNFYGLKRTKAVGFYLSFLLGALLCMMLLFMLYLLIMILKI